MLDTYRDLPGNWLALASWISLPAFPGFLWVPLPLEEGDPLNGLVAVYTSHVESPLDAIGRLEGLAGLAASIASGGSRGFVVLSTCNRFEVYLDRPGAGVVERLARLIEEAGGSPRIARGRRAAVRIARIASGLESRILGETEILGQVREAWEAARREGHSSSILDMVFHTAIVAGRRVRRETGISQGPAGYPAAAVALAAERLGGLDNARILVAGAGKAGRGLVRSLCQRWRPSLIVIATRDPEGARWVERLCPHAVVVGRDSARRYAPYDAALLAVSEPGGLEWVPRASRVVVDISVPPAVGGGNVYGIDSVEAVVAKIVGERRRWLPAAERIVEEEVSRLEDRLRQRRVAPVLRLLRLYAERAAMDVAARYPGGDPEYTRRTLLAYADKLLHPIVSSLRRASSNGWRLEDFVRELERMLGERLDVNREAPRVPQREA